ncbi:uncharacterized protein LOC115447779 [Manduca sexta]|uniref:Uncharacterized protein n=1 Tax=Manduca sexta TaxID=7130 RepID=A0A922CSL1_MANSE|nr:uncharacterized protein LOC115447779 [Manduca sexta]KAG6456799.1 hypothetical protein O3G_MSEX009962 [Manduca sexta]
MADSEISTPVNTITRENLTVLLANNILNNSVEFSDNDMMETDSPIRKPCVKIIGKKLFHSPLSQNSDSMEFNRTSIERSRRMRKRKILIPDYGEGIKKAYVKECDKDGYSPEASVGMRRRVLISLFHNKEYCMDVGY